MVLRIDLQGRSPVRPLHSLTCLARWMRLWNGFCQRFVLWRARRKYETGLVRILDVAVLGLLSPQSKPSPYP